MRRSDLPAKNDNAVCLKYRVVPFAGKSDRRTARSLYVDPDSSERGYAQGFIQQQVRFWGR
ncbi:hypothetical protein QK293_10930, partial [Pseudomonas sp. AL03]|nr:hypothetical protein [Pseudomonas sp. AL03]